jgi:hypothetical protein
MRNRCNNPNNKSYKYYGGRGIEVCERWGDFLDFIEDMGERPIGYTLERIDVDGNYEPSNCKWATWSEQVKNRRKYKYPPKSDEHKRKIGLASSKRKGELASMWGKTHTSETKEKMSEKAKDKTIYKFKHNVHGVEECTRSELISKYNLNDSNMSMLISGKYKTHKGWSLC